MFFRRNKRKQEVQMEVEDLEKYKKEFSEERFWDKIKKFGKKLGCGTLKQVLILFYVFLDPDTPIQHKAVIIGALGYFILPTDLIPDLMPVLGFSDDATAIATAINTIAASIKDKHKEQAERKIKEFC